jgi:hypothetical protein
MVLRRIKKNVNFGIFGITHLTKQGELFTMKIKKRHF